MLCYFVVDLVLEPYAQRIGSWLTADALRCLAVPILLMWTNPKGTPETCN